MNIETARSFFLWCSIINYALLILWVVLVTIGRAWLYPLLTRFYRVSPEQLNLLNFGGITLYKTGIFLFNIVPCIALYIVK